MLRFSDFYRVFRTQSQPKMMRPLTAASGWRTRCLPMKRSLTVKRLKIYRSDMMTICMGTGCDICGCGRFIVKTLVLSAEC